MLTPWLILTVLTALLNLGLFLLVRGRWGRIAAVLALAALAGTAAGNAIGERTGLELVRIGDFHLVAASAGAQLAMLAALLLSALSVSVEEAPRVRRQEREGEGKGEPSPGDEA